MPATMAEVKIYRLLGIIISIISTTGISNSAKILVIPRYHKSHVNLFGVAGSALRQNGHNITFMVSNTFVTDPEKYNLKPLIYDLTEDAIHQNHVAETIRDHMPLYEQIYTRLSTEPTIVRKVCDQVLGNVTIMEAIRKENFDLVLLDGYPMLHCFYVIPYRFNISYMTLTALPDPWSLGVSVSAAIEPMVATRTNNQLTFCGRLITALFYTFLSKVMPNLRSSMTYVQKYAPQKPVVSLHMLYSRSEIFLVNQEIMCVDYPRASMPHYQYIGGSSAKPAEHLPQDFAAFMDTAQDGVIIVSFGSMPAWQKIWKVLKPKLSYAFRRVPQKAVVLYSLDENIDEFPSNVKTSKWLPQNDLLGHAKTKLFITHGGNNGQLEAVYHGVPSLVLPIASDQLYNGIRVETHGYGKMVEAWDTISEQDLLKVLLEVLTNDSYSRNVRKCSNIIKSWPSTQERIVYWVNHILEFGGSHLRPPSLGMPLYQLLMIDMILFIAFVFVVCTSVTLLCCSLCIKQCCLAKKEKIKKE